MVNLYDELEVNTIYVRETISDILGIPFERINFNPVKRTATITLKRNRHVSICLHQLKALKEEFECDDIILTSPYRCVIDIKFWYNPEHQCCDCKCRKHNTIPKDKQVPVNVNDGEIWHRIFKPQEEPVYYLTVTSGWTIWFNKCSKIVGYSYFGEDVIMQDISEEILEIFERECEKLYLEFEPKGVISALEDGYTMGLLESYNTKREEVLDNG